MSVYISIYLSPFWCHSFEASHWPSGHMIRSRPLIGRHPHPPPLGFSRGCLIFFFLLDHICFTLRSWVHEVFSRFGTVSPGLGDNYASKCGSGIFPRTKYMSRCVEKSQNHILMHSCLPIPGRPCQNVRKLQWTQDLRVKHIWSKKKLKKNRQPRENPRGGGCRPMRGRDLIMWPEGQWEASNELHQKGTDI